MGYPIEVRKFSYVSPPRAYGTAGPIGQIIRIPVTTSAGMVELDNTVFGLTYSSGGADPSLAAPAPGAGKAIGLTGNYLTLQAVGAAVSVIFAADPFSVSGGNVPVAATQGSVSSRTTTSGTNGATTTPPAGSSSVQFTDSTAAAFTSAMVGKPIKITGGSFAVNDGIFEILNVVSSSVVTINNPAAVTDTAMSWSVITGGAYTGAAGTAFTILQGDSLRVLLEVGKDVFLGYVGSASGTLEMYTSNPSGMEE